MKILAINPGSTSTKVGLFEDAARLFDIKAPHERGALKILGGLMDQLDFRLQVVRDALTENGIALKDLDAVAARGGLLRPLKGGTYRVNARMLEDLKAGVMGEHASNLGGLMAHALVADLGVPAFIVDPVVVDEMIPPARLTGVPEIRRNSIFHALNQKAAARKAAAELHNSYEKLNLVVAHLGGGVSVGAHARGRVIDVNDALYGDGPMGPERAGRVPPYAFAQLAISKGWSERDIKRRLVGNGGMAAHLGTTDMQAVLERVRAGDEKAVLVYESMIHQIAREIGAMAAVLRGNVDAVVLTGGLAHSAEFIEQIQEYVKFIGPLIVIPGEEELEALAAGALRVLKGEEDALEY